MKNVFVPKYKENIFIKKLHFNFGGSVGVKNTF